MVSILKRMRRIRRLLDVKLGPGAAILPPEVTKIHMDFHVDGEGEHKGARTFWKTQLRRLKYHNPTIPMTVSRTKAPLSTLMTIHFTSPSSSDTPPPVTSTASPVLSSGSTTHSTPAPPTERTESIEMREMGESDIWTRLKDLTGAKEVQPTEEEERQIKELEEHAKRAELDRERVQAALARMRKEQEAFEAAVKMGD